MSKFVINKGIGNEFIITIKQNGTTLPMAIEAGDTFVTKLVKLSDGSVVATPTTSAHDSINGKIKIVFSQEQISTLTMERGDRADYYYSKPLYQLIIDCNTENNGKFVAKVAKVYVE
jgi:hypothetical protein